jgi:hypothetical protein
MSKRIAMCIASRGNPVLLLETLHSILSQSALPTTTAVIGLDDDDPHLTDARAGLDALGSRQIVVSIAERADSIGAVYNRCAAAFDADLYINGADDFRILTRGWDALLSQSAEFFPDDIGMLGFGQMPWDSMLPALAAATRGLIEKMGYFMQDFTPYWWMDVWLYEIATMIGRNHYVPIDLEMIAPTRTRGLREFGYWYAFVDDMRVHRRAIAESILASPEFLVSAERRQELRENLDHVCAEFASGRPVVLDPANVARIEMGGYDTPDDERYRRIKARSMKVLQEWQRRGGVAA